jgi:hypothetical protein
VAQLQTRLHQHTEVISHILSFTDHQSLLPCLRVSTQFHAIASLHIGKIYKHVTIDRDSITSVFAGIRWDEMEESWLDERDRWRKGRGRFAVKNKAKQEFSYQALFSGVSWEDMDEGWSSVTESWISPPSPSPFPPTKLQSPLYGSNKSDRHAWKAYALSRCTQVTLCDTWATFDRDARNHTHNVLHNGKAHHLFPLVETIRVIPLTSAHSNITPLCSSQEHCPFIQEIGPKKLVHRNVTADGYELTSEPVDELVIFVPNNEWPDDSDPFYRIAPLEHRLAKAGSKIIKLVFGPPLAGKNRSNRHVQYDDLLRPEDRDRFHLPLERLINLIRNACAQSTMTHIYGLEKVKIPKPNDNWFETYGGRQRMWSYNELLTMIKASLLDDSGPSVVSDPLAVLNPPGPHHNYRIHLLREYVSSYPDDELLEHELNGTDCWAWQTTEYWSQPYIKGSGKGKGKGAGRGQDKR